MDGWVWETSSPTDIPIVVYGANCNALSVANTSWKPQELFPVFTRTGFYRSRTPPEIIWMALSALAEDLDIRGAVRVFEVKPDDVQDWLEQASRHMELFLDICFMTCT